MADKQTQLNGAYYGPAVPPPSKTYHRPGRGGGFGCCGSLFGLIFKIIATIVVVLGLALLILWLIFRPNKVKFYVTDATLTQFNFTSTNMLNYNLAVNMTIRNPNKKIGIFYDTIEATALYEGQRFDTVWLTPFYQGHKTTSTLNPVFDGQQLVLLGANELSQFNTEKNAGVFTVDVKLYLKVRFRLGKVRIGKFKPDVECDFKVPLSSSNGSRVAGFQSTKCDVDF